MFERLKRWFGGEHAGGDGAAGDEMIPCEQALASLYEFMDGELDGVSEAAVEAHFEVCTRCYPHLSVQRSFRTRVQTALSRPDVPAGLRDRVLELLAGTESET
jgi:mycothiol system anti-sigma-R factor